MKVGIGLSVSPRNWVEFAQAAENAGYDSFWLPEHLILPVKMSGKPGTPNEGTPPISSDTPAFDPFVVMAYLAGQTRTIRMGTNVYNIGLRHPFITARALTTLDMASGGRVDFGIGSSWLGEEWEAMQLPFEHRGRRVDESIRIIQRLFTEDVVEHSGEYFQFQPVKFQPKPTQSPWPPFLIGGDAPVSIRRAALLGDGWIPMAQTAESLAANIRKIGEMRAEAGRTGPFEVIMNFGRRYAPDDLKRFRDAGLDKAVVIPWTSAKDGIDSLNRFAEEMMPQLA